MPSIPQNTLKPNLPIFKPGCTSPFPSLRPSSPSSKTLAAQLFEFLTRVERTQFSTGDGFAKLELVTS